jgi:hypothetical protein
MRFNQFGPLSRPRAQAIVSLLLAIAIWYGTTFHHWRPELTGLPWGGLGFDDFGLSVFNANDYAGPDSYFRVPHVVIVAAAIAVCVLSFRRMNDVQRSTTIPTCPPSESRRKKSSSP